MDFNGLKASYWKQQIQRVENVRQKIVERTDAVRQGRIIPDSDDLTIGTGRRLSAAVMFIDICSFSSRNSENQDEQAILLSTLNLFFSEMIKIAEDYDGVVEKHTGDGLMVYFKDSNTPPVSAPQKAVSCALTMMAANDYLINPILRQSSIEEIKFRVGIEYGSITIAKMGAAKRFNANVAIGTTANIASKMLVHAGENEILIGAAARSKLPDSWKTSWTGVHSASSGWVYISDKSPYSFYKYTGRWHRLM